MVFVASCALVYDRMVLHYHCVKCNHDKRKEDMRTKPKNKQGICKQCHDDTGRDDQRQQIQQQQQQQSLPIFIHNDNESNHITKVTSRYCYYVSRKKNH